MTFSTVPAVKAALVERLSARAGLDGVLITWGWPPAPSAEWIMVGEADGDQEARGINAAAMPKRETYTLVVVVSVLRSPDDARGATERAFAIADEIDTELRADPTLGGVAGLLYATPNGTFELIEGVSPESREGRVTLSIACSARL